MFNKTNINALKEMKKDLETTYVSFFNDGSQKSDNGKYVKSHCNNILGDQRNLINYSLESVVERLVFMKTNFDQIDIDMMFGIVYKEDTLKDGKEILPTSEAIDKMVRFYTRDIHAYYNGEEVHEFSEKTMINYQGFINFDNYIKKHKADGLSIIGPNSYEELKTLVESGFTEDMKISISFQDKLDKEEEPVKKRSIFKK